MPKTILAIDCDLHRIHAIDSNGVVVCKNHPTLELILDHPCELVLFEIASPVDYTREANKAVAHNKRRWTIFNAIQAARLGHYFKDDMLVAPSSAWTRGFDRETRHTMAGCNARTKDLREAQAMIWFYLHYPKAWTSLQEFTDHL